MSLAPLPHKDSKFCGDEVQKMTRSLLDNVYLFRVSEDEAFDKMAESLRGKRTKEQVRAWWYNLKKIYQEEGRWTEVVKKSILEDHKNQLIELINGPKPTVILKSSAESVERNAPGEAALRSEEETNENKNINKDEIFYKGSIQSEQIGSSDAMEVHQGEESAISKGNESIEKAIQEAILKLYKVLSPGGRKGVRQAIEQL